MTLKPFVVLACLVLVAACAEFGDREARCACFGPDGEPTGNCKFTPVAGAPVQFSFLADTARTSAKACDRA